MRYLTKHLVILMIIFIFSVLVTNCVNIFTPLFPEPQDLSSINDVEYLVNMGDYYANLGDYEKAYRFYSKALEIQDNHTRALIGIANCEFFKVVNRTNLLSFAEELSSNLEGRSNYMDFVDYFITNSNYYSAFGKISKYTYRVISGDSSDKSQASNINLHFLFAIVNKIYSLYYSLDSDQNNIVNSNDVTYSLLKDLINSDSNYILPNKFIFSGGDIHKGLNEFFILGKLSIESLTFITNKMLSKENSIETSILSSFVSIDSEISNRVSIFYNHYYLYLDMSNRIYQLLAENGISNASFERLTNALRITNYANFDGTDITNILSTNNSEAWNILTNYLDINLLTN